MPSWAWGLIGGGGLAVPALLMCIALALRKGRAETAQERANGRAAAAEQKLFASQERHQRLLEAQKGVTLQREDEIDALAKTIRDLRDAVQEKEAANARLLKLLPADQRAAVARTDRADFVRRREAEDHDDRDSGPDPDDAA